MRVEKWVFLLSYAIYLVFCILFSLTSKDLPAINTMIFAITVTSTAFSISDLIFTKLDIDKKERESLFALYALHGYAKKFYLYKLEKKYRTEAEELISSLIELFNEAEVDKMLSGKLSKEEKEKYLEMAQKSSNSRLYEYVELIFKSREDNEFEDTDSNDEGTTNVLDINKIRKKEAMRFKIASSIGVIGLIALLIILTIRIEPISHVNDVLTIIAFLSVIISLFLKDYYKANSLKTLDAEKKKLMKDLSNINE